MRQNPRPRFAHTRSEHTALSAPVRSHTLHPSYHSTHELGGVYRGAEKGLSNAPTVGVIPTAPAAASTSVIAVFMSHETRAQDASYRVRTILFRTAVEDIRTQYANKDRELMTIFENIKKIEDRMGIEPEDDRRTA
jgi:hypothetical protein